MNNGSKQILAAIVALVAIACAFVFGVAATGHVDTNSTPLISTVLGFVGIGVVALVNFLGTQKTHEKVNAVDKKVDKVLNGAMDEKIRGILSDLLIRHENGQVSHVESIPVRDDETPDQR